MIDDTQAGELATAAVRRGPSEAPAHLLDAALARVERTPQRSRSRWQPPLMAPSARRVVTGGVAAALIMIVAITWLSPGSHRSGAPVAPFPTPTPGASPSTSPSAGSTPSASPVAEATPGMAESPRLAPRPLEMGQTPPLQLLTSTEFGLPVSFWLREWSLYRGSSDWCDAASTTDRSIVLTWAHQCDAAVRILRPATVSCDTPDSSPSVDELAAALLGNRGLKAVDLGRIEDDALLAGQVFAGPMRGRVIQVPGNARPFDPEVADPDACLLGFDAASGDRPVEIRGDMFAYLVLFEVGGELIVLRVDDAGYDGPSGRVVRRGGYDGDSAGALVQGMLQTIHDLKFE